MLKKKIWANFQRMLKFLPKNFSRCSQIYGFGIRDPRSGKNLFRIPDPGVKKAPDPGSQIRIRNTALVVTDTKSQRKCKEQKTIHGKIMADLTIAWTTLSAASPNTPPAVLRIRIRHPVPF
jgi:hypothetical protein